MQKISTEWSFYHPVRVVSTRLASYLATISGRSLLLVTTAGFTRRGLTGKIAEWAGNNRLQVYDQIRPNPDLDQLDLALESLRGQKFDSILAVGGGSVIDAAKAFSIALALPVERPLSAILRDNRSADVSGRIPVIAVPTTSGTGSEVTQYATLWDLTNGLKCSLAGEHIFPTTAILDSELSLSLPPQETLYTGLDAVSHALESLWNINRNPISELYAISALALACENLPAVLAAPENRHARTGMQHASLFAGYAISITRTAIAHAISYPLTARLSIPHGLACGFTLAALIDMQRSSQNLPDHCSSLLERVKALLLSFNLAGEMRRYATAIQITDLLPEMFDPSRIKNYNTFADAAMVARILAASGCCSGNA